MGERRRRGGARAGLLAALGALAALAALVGPIPDAAGHDVRAHMAGHLLLGMIAPLLLVAANPVRAALRVLPTAAARRLVRVLHGRPVGLLTHSATATVLDVGGLWVLYRTPLLGAMMTSPLLHALVTVHVFGAGVLFTHAVVGWDPRPHRPSIGVRAAFLVAGLAAHDVLAKSLYASPVAMGGVGARDGAMLMYYGGDAVDVVLMVMLGAQWYAATGRQLQRNRRARAKTTTLSR